MKIYIKNMVCQGTRKFVLMEVKKLRLNLKSFESGEMEFQGELSPSEKAALEYRLSKYGLEMVHDGIVSEYNTASYKQEIITAEAV